ncbi:hypothetical protein U9M48_012685 [Paspalum notatum var. saurae]|uniref:Uncharacterized protein n=1 Tax=Paspalum notatum var. saurae TaxID=547442 RepID=A0AAQ3SYR4_PASNO
MNKNLVSGSLLLRDGFKVVLESNKVIVSRHGLFIGKGYVSGGLFRLSLSDFSNKCVNIFAVVLMMMRVFGMVVYVTLILVLSAIVVCNLSNLESLTRLLSRGTWHL